MDNTIFTTTMQLIATAFSCIHAASTIIRLVTTFDKPSRDIDAGDSWHARVVTIKKKKCLACVCLDQSMQSGLSQRSHGSRYELLERGHRPNGVDSQVGSLSRGKLFAKLDTVTFAARILKCLGLWIYGTWHSLCPF